MTSKFISDAKKSAREEYIYCKQGGCESIVDCKRYFNARLDSCKSSSKTAIPDEDVVIDFMYGLEYTIYAELKLEIINGICLGGDDIDKGPQHNLCTG